MLPEITSIARPENPELERQLWTALQAGDESAETQLVEYHLALVVKVIRRLDIQVHNHVDPRELLGVGVLGLHQAVRRYDPKSGVAFSFFAEIRIRGALIDELRQRDPLTRPQRQTIRRVQQMAAELTLQHGRFPTEAELASATELTQAQVTQHLGMAADPVNLEEEFEDGLRYMDVIPDHQGVDPSAKADITFGLEAMKAAIPKLSTREQQLLYLRHHEELGVKEIAEVLSVSVGRVSQMYNEILAKLRILMQIKS